MGTGHGLKDLIGKMMRYENSLYSLYKLGETLSKEDKYSETFRIMAEEEIRHAKTLGGVLEGGGFSGVVDYLDALYLEPMVSYRGEAPGDFRELLLEALKMEKYAYEMYLKMSEITEGSLRHIFRMMASEELAHAYRVRLIYGSLG